jgi:rifampin ADP-ribosylating transferase
MDGHAGDEGGDPVTATDDRGPRRFFHGTKADLKPGDLIEPGDPSDLGERDRTASFVHLKGSVDAAAWQSELAPGEGPGRIYTVEPTGPVESDAEEAAKTYPVDAALSYRSPAALRVTGEVTDRRGHPQQLYHGTKADLDVGDLIEPGRSPNFGERGRTTTYVYLTGTLDAATWGAELATGEGPGRIYTVEPTGPIMDDPNLTDAKYPGNPTKSYRSREPLRVTGEVTDWQGHPPEALKAMTYGLERLERQGVQPLDD